MPGDSLNGLVGQQRIQCLAVGRRQLQVARNLLATAERDANRHRREVAAPMVLARLGKGAVFARGFDGRRRGAVDVGPVLGVSEAYAEDALLAVAEGYGVAALRVSGRTKRAGDGRTWRPSASW